ncbi:MAG: acyl-CoA reductase [Saprospiraceae bacterium]
MTLNDKITLLTQLGKYLQTDTEELAAVKHKAYLHNKWFTVANIDKALSAISEAFLQEDKLRAWLKPYKIEDTEKTKTVALVLAGNIPLVGFHDVISVFLAGHRALIKLSEKDKFLLPFLVNQMLKIAPAAAAYFEFTERLQQFDAVIATGSNNSARYFESYFSKYPNIIRKNRSSVAILNGKESSEVLLALGSDVFDYFGLGCRNVSKLYLPQGYDFDALLRALYNYKEVVLHDKYKNNFDYNYTLLILNKIAYEANGCILLTEATSLQSRIACLHYEYYSDEADLAEKLSTKMAEIQCVVGEFSLAQNEVIPMGKAQQPTLSDYADGVDTMQFLVEI